MESGFSLVIHSAFLTKPLTKINNTVNLRVNTKDLKYPNSAVNQCKTHSRILKLKYNHESKNIYGFPSFFIYTVYSFRNTFVLF